MIPSEVRAVFFDAVGTLIHPDPAAAPVYAEIGRRHGSSRTFAEIGLRFAQAFAEEEATDRANNLRTSEERELGRWRTIVARVLDDVHDTDACFRDLYQHFAQPAAWRLEPAAAVVLNELANRGYVLGLASNYDRRLHSVLDGWAELRRLKRIVISSEVGWRKPAPEFFAAMCGCVGLRPAEVLYVGDDPVNDYDGASAAGVHAILFDGPDRHSAFAGRRLRALSLLAWKGIQGGTP